MTITFTNEEEKYIYTDADMKLKCKEGTPDQIIEALRVRIEAFNKWVDEMNGGPK